MAIEAVQNCFDNLGQNLSSGCSSICDAIGSIPGAIQKKLDECCTTDFKVYGLVVLGRVLQAASIIGFAAVIFSVAVTGPFALFGLVPAIATAILGTYVAQRPDDVHDAIFPLPPYVPNQPVGLVNTANNCWANASMQLLMNAPNLLNSDAARRIPQVVQLSQAYAATQTQQGRVVQNADGQLIRNALVSVGQAEAGNVQQDAAQFFEYVFEPPHSLYQMYERIHRSDGVSDNLTPIPFVSLQLQENASPPFPELFQGFFDYQDGDEQRHELKLQQPPDDLLIQLKRFYTPLRDGRPIPIDAQGHVQIGKHNQQIAVPANFSLNPQQTHNGLGANYECDGFIVHYGTNPHVGHFVAYIKRAGSWWECNDRRIRPIAQEYAERLMHAGYIYHFKKTPAT